MHQHSSPNAETKQEKVLFVPLTSIDDFPDHPFQVKDDEEMQKLMTSIQIEGVLSPLIVRQKENGRYELISGHRRKYACQSLNLEQVPVIVRDFSREEAVIAMVDSNLQRERILPSEKSTRISHENGGNEAPRASVRSDLCTNGAQVYGGENQRRDRRRAWRKSGAGAQIYPFDVSESRTLGNGGSGKDRFSTCRGAFLFDRGGTMVSE